MAGRVGPAFLSAACSGKKDCAPPRQVHIAKLEYALYFLLAAHLAAVGFHTFVKRDGPVTRMTGRG